MHAPRQVPFSSCCILQAFVIEEKENSLHPQLIQGKESVKPPSAGAQMVPFSDWQQRKQLQAFPRAVPQGHGTRPSTSPGDDGEKIGECGSSKPKGTAITEETLALCSPVTGEEFDLRRQSRSHWWAPQLLPALGKQRRIYPSLPPHPDFDLTSGRVFQLTTALSIQTIPEDHPYSCQQNMTGLVALMEQRQGEAVTMEPGPNVKSLQKQGKESFL